MEQAMETYNSTKRTAEDAGLVKTASPKIAKRFYLPPQFDTTSYEIQCHTNWTGKKLPIYVSKGYKAPTDGKIRTKAICTPMLATKFVDLGENGDIGKFGKTEVNACYNMKTVHELPEKITSKVPNAQEKADEFYQYLRDVTMEMLKTGFETDGVWTKWKKKAEKDAAKNKKKNPDSTMTAWDFSKMVQTQACLKRLKTKTLAMNNRCTPSVHRINYVTTVKSKTIDLPSGNKSEMSTGTKR